MRGSTIVCFLNNKETCHVRTSFKAFYDSTAGLIVQCAASGKGLEACIIPYRRADFQPVLAVH